MKTLIDTPTTTPAPATGAAGIPLFPDVDPKHFNPDLRHDVVFLFDVVRGNPNGDPDAMNLPRQDSETGHGFMTDGSIKAKVRSYVSTIHNQEMFIAPGEALNSRIERVANARGVEKSKKTRIDGLAKDLAEKYWDIRMFGAVLSTGDYNAGQVWGPMQVLMPASIDPITPVTVAITRRAKTRADSQAADGDNEMGDKHIVPYALYRGEALYNPYRANLINEQDLREFYDALVNMFHFDVSAARGRMTSRGVYVFTHDTPRGNAHADQLFEQVTVERANPTVPARSFKDYQVQVDEGTPPGVTLARLL